MIEMLAPVVVFAYNRPGHLNKTLTALSANRMAKDSEVFLFIDGPKDDKGKEKTIEVIKVAKSFVNNRFKNVQIHISENNKGLAKSIIGGVTEIINQYGKVIVVEDDAVSAVNYLDFMNGALDFYKNDDTVWSIGGFTVPMQIPADYKYDVIKTQRVSSYAWAIWKDRWEKIDWDVKDYRKFRGSLLNRHQFNNWGNDRSCMLDDQINGIVDSWAIRFDYAMYKNDRFNIVPRESLIKNIGHDGSGTHGSGFKTEHDVFDVNLDNSTEIVRFDRVDTDERIRKEFCKPFYCSIGFRLKKYLLQN